ncbi:MAG: MoaD/ThiS family protein [Egibacteraceae bacterium]
MTEIAGAALDALGRDHPGVAWRIRDERGHLRPHVNVYVGAEPLRDLGGLTAPVQAGDELVILPAVSGG